MAENTAPGGNVGAPVKAMGRRELWFTHWAGLTPSISTSVVPMVRSLVGTGTSFDYDDPEIPNRFSVTVKVEVTGGDANQKAEVDVVIIVTDVDELPVITDAETAVNYPEIDEDGAPNAAAVATYVGTDPEGDTISWDLRGADAALFTIAGGVLEFMAAPDFEDPKDVAGANTATPDADA